MHCTWIGILCISPEVRPICQGRFGKGQIFYSRELMQFAWGVEQSVSVGLEERSTYGKGGGRIEIYLCCTIYKTLGSLGPLPKKGIRTLDGVLLRLEWIGSAQVSWWPWMQIRKIWSLQSANAWVDHFLDSHREDIRQAVGRIVLPSQRIQVGPATLFLSRGYLANLHRVFRIGNWELVRLDESGQRLKGRLTG